MLPYGRQTIEDDDIAAVVEALKADFLTTGPRVEGFEAAFAETVGADHAVACSNGTAALHLALLNRGVLLTPFHNMVLACPAHTLQDADALTSAFDAALAALRAA